MSRCFFVRQNGGSGSTNSLNAPYCTALMRVSRRVWDQGDVVDAILKNYERLDDEIKAELPMKRIWVMVNDDAD